MFNTIKVLSITACAAFLLQSCHSDDGALYNIASEDAPKQVAEVDTRIYGSLRANPDIDSLFKTAALVSGRLSAQAPTGGDLGTEPCQVKLHKMSYDTVGGAGEATTSTGVVMIPYSDDVSSVCNEPRPVVMYAHGTTADRNYDLSKIISDPSNPANSEGMIMLAMYASEGYVVIAPNYAGYADSALSYHPYVDEAQQSTEMLNALDHVRANANGIGANLSSKLFVTGVSQGGYVALATHKALEARNETVTASLPISGPYALGNFLDAIMVAGKVNGGATTFAPMYLTALQKAHAIYTNANEVYTSSTTAELDYASFAENSLPAPGKNQGSDVGLPAAALFNSTTFTAPTGFEFGYDESNYLLSDTFRSQYMAAFGGDQTANAAKKARDLSHAGDLTAGWAPAASVTLCGAATDPVVFHSVNSLAAAAALGVTSLDLDAAPTTPTTVVEGINATIQQQWQTDVANGAITQLNTHQSTAAYCAGAGLGLFNSLK